MYIHKGWEQASVLLSVSPKQDFFRRILVDKSQKNSCKFHMNVNLSCMYCVVKFAVELTHAICSMCYLYDKKDLK